MVKQLFGLWRNANWFDIIYIYEAAQIKVLEHCSENSWFLNSNVINSGTLTSLKSSFIYFVYISTSSRMNRHYLGILDTTYFFKKKKISVRLLSVLRGHSFFSSPPQRPMTSDFEGFSIPDFIHYIYFPVLILEKEPVFSLLKVQC